MKVFYQYSSWQVRIFDRVFLTSLFILLVSCGTTKNTIPTNFETTEIDVTVVESTSDPSKQSKEPSLPKEDLQADSVKQDKPEIAKKIKEPEVPKTIDSGRESKRFPHQQINSVAPQLLEKLAGYWLPLQFFQEIEKKGSLLDVPLFPPVGSIRVEGEEVQLILPNGKEHKATISGKPADLLFVTDTETYHFALRGGELVWSAGNRKISYRRSKNLEITFTSLMNEAIMSGTYFSMLTRTLIAFYDDGRVAGMGKKYTNYRFPQNQEELERSSRSFDIIYLYNKSRPKAGAWYALVLDSRNDVKVIARIREFEDRWILSNNAYMLKPHNY